MTFKGECTKRGGEVVNGLVEFIGSDCEVRESGWEVVDRAVEIRRRGDEVG